MENKTEVQLKAKATNWLLTALLGVVSWFGMQAHQTLQQISQDLKSVSGMVQVHESEISNLKLTTSDLRGKIDQVLLSMYTKQFARREEIIDYPKRNK